MWDGSVLSEAAVVRSVFRGDGPSWEGAAAAPTAPVPSSVSRDSIRASRPLAPQALREAPRFKGRLKPSEGFCILFHSADWSSTCSSIGGGN